MIRTIRSLSVMECNNVVTYDVSRETLCIFIPWMNQ